MNRAFTLIELMVVMAIMGLLGTVSVGGYRAMQRGMEERGVMQSVNSFIRTAYQRAQIDRQPVVVFFWNETERLASEEHTEVVVGRAVAVRRYGRISAVSDGLLIDEFADLNLTYPEQDDKSNGSGSSARQAGNFIYPMENLSELQSGTALRRTAVAQAVRRSTQTVNYLFKQDGGETPLAGGQNDSQDQIPAYGFEVVDMGGVSWKTGMAYGMEIMNIRLPNNYLFGSQYSSSMGNPISGAGTLVFDVAAGGGNGLITGGTQGRNSLPIYSLRPNGANLQAVKVADSDNPERSLL